MSFLKSGDDSSKPSIPTSGSSVGSTGVANSSANSVQIEAFLGKGSKVVGNLTFTGPADLDGYVEGEVHSKERLTIGESAVINAKISGAEIIVKGTVTGDIFASKRLSLKKPARVTGNITSANLSIEEGVVFEGKCAMSTVVNASSTANSGTTTGASPAAGRSSSSEKSGAPA